MDNNSNDSLSGLASTDLHSLLDSLDPTSYSQISDFSTQDSSYSGIPDSIPDYGIDSSAIPDDSQSYQSPADFHHTYHQPFDYAQNSGYEDSLRYSDNGYNVQNAGDHAHHPQVFNCDTQVMQSACTSHNCLSITIKDHGSIYKHTSGSSIDTKVGYVDGRSIYNPSHYKLGYAGTDGKVYDNHDHCVGWVDGCHVYNKSGIEVYDTTRGVVGAAAYLLCVYYGGVN